MKRTWVTRTLNESTMENGNVSSSFHARQLLKKKQIHAQNIHDGTEDPEWQKYLQDFFLVSLPIVGFHGIFYTTIRQGIIFQRKCDSHKLTTTMKSHAKALAVGFGFFFPVFFGSTLLVQLDRKSRRLINEDNNSSCNDVLEESSPGSLLVGSLQRIWYSRIPDGTFVRLWPSPALGPRPVDDNTVPKEVIDRYGVDISPLKIDISGNYWASVIAGGGLSSFLLLRSLRFRKIPVDVPQKELQARANVILKIAHGTMKPKTRAQQEMLRNK